MHTKILEKFWLPLGIFIFALVLRVFLLGDIPWGFQWDEASYAYNAYSIMLTGKDEWNISHPLFLKAFGDYKPALLSYAMIPFFKTFSVSEFSARLPVVLLASLGIVGFYFFLKKKSGVFAAIVGAVVLALSPWHMHYSRIAFDPMVSLSFMLMGLAFFGEVKSLKKRLLGILFFTIAMYTYNSARVFIPVLIILHEVFLYPKKELKKYLQSNGVVIVVAALSIAVILASTLTSSAGDRARKVFFWDAQVATSEVEQGIYRSVVTGLPFIRVFHNKGIYISNTFITQYMSHFSPEFLLKNNNQSPAFSFSHAGYMLSVFIPFLLLGLFSKKRKGLWWFFFVWLIASPIPSSLSISAPNGNRALLMLPALSYFIVLGIEIVFELLQKVPTVVLSGSIRVGIIGILIFANLVYLRDYYLFFPEESEAYWHGFYSEAMVDLYAQKDDYNQIYISEGDTQVYIFLAWYNLINPEVVQAAAADRDVNSINGIGQLENFSITTIKEPEAPCLLKKENVLVISSEPDGVVLPEKVFTPDKMYYHLTRYLPKDKVALRVYDSNKVTETQKAALQRLCVDDLE
ncbi:MAG: hypothetical protein GW762_04800 [Candidatus Pacebacteria bacterium]|nr:hypothetical protein [Candidatus Paceibacterota bacterium]PIR63260.1 MAG: hypothetical protein COU64_05535 [Candidatus Pacebacteria bacterium CG10_big_fil_rev_8_21_14_0_10_40_26]PIZ78316.1 MAG: hypothetical protein COY01_06060 [Candidatus Pacebacteria bacterium CG_4_10_14_0_2_um_filter_40_20]PJA68640.1 MAG: hypothetical protein CO156_03985 [Candidatus Pacebacteria bacterium CG_4_9_14_3_um_filter_40_12]PJC41580.1 MAG: hypothetical protein CO041_02575 [Candidatus Pacebacteria bacterium CG_4_9_